MVCYPREMTHASLIGTPLEISATLVHLSVGIEEPEDLIADLERALAAAAKASGADSIQHRSLATA